MANMQSIIKVNGVVVEIKARTSKEIFADFYGYPVRINIARNRVIIRNLQTGRFQSLRANF